jgi:hypothetical protein
MDFMKRELETGPCASKQLNPARLEGHTPHAVRATHRPQSSRKLKDPADRLTPLPQDF